MIMHQLDINNKNERTSLRRDNTFALFNIVTKSYIMLFKLNHEK